MTVPSTIRKAGPYNGNDVATSFAFSFKVFTSADIAVTVADVDGTETLLVLDSDYSVTLNGDQDASPGGSITYPLSGTPLATGEALVIVGDLDYGQDYDVPTGGNFNPTAMEDALDKQAMRTQQLLEINDRSMTLAVTSAADVSTSLPAPVASQFLGWNATANAIINYAGVAGVAVSSFMEGVVAAATGALARAALGITAIGDALATAASAAAARNAIGGAASGAVTGSGLTMSTARVLLRTTAGTGAIEEATAAQLSAFAAAATDTAQGVSELATTAETQTGSDAARTVTPAGLRGALGLSHSFTSTAQTITPAGSLTLAHSMGVKPRFINAWLVCTTGELGFSIGDEVAVSFTQESDAGSDNRAMSLWRDVTNINIRFGSSANVFVLSRKDTGVGTSATNGSWALVIEALA